MTDHTKPDDLYAHDPVRQGAQNMTDKEHGIYCKYSIARTDGSSGPGGKHEHCSYFVLDLRHDAFAIQALRAYAEACRVEYPGLARDLECICSATTEED